MIKMSLISEILSCVLAHVCEFDDDMNWIFRDRSEYDAYRAKPMPTITDIESYHKSDCRAICLYIINHNIQKSQMHNIILDMLHNTASPITHEFVIEHRISENIPIYVYFSDILEHIHGINSSTLLYILAPWRPTPLDTEVDFEFINDFTPHLEYVTETYASTEIVYGILSEQFQPRGRLTKPAPRYIFN